MSRHRVYWSSLTPGEAAFNFHVATPANEQDEIYPSVSANRQGEVLNLDGTPPPVWDTTGSS